MSRIQSCFQQLKANGKKALIPYLTAGDPNIETTLGLMHAVVANGADLIELGFPFSDPSADGPVVQRAIERSLAKKTKLKDVIETVRQFRKTNTTTPVVLMGYLNPVECMGYQKFADAAVTAGIDGVLLVDMPPEEDHDLRPVLRNAGLETIYLVAPTSNPERIESICKHSTGYLYYVSLKGVTGASHLDVDSVISNLARLRKHTSLPLGVGFGIRDAESAARISKVSDAVVVGSALINKIAELPDRTDHTPQQLKEKTTLLAQMRAAMDAAR